VDRLIAAGQWTAGDREILVVADAGYDVTRLAFVLADLPVVLLGRLRSDRVLRLTAPLRRPGTGGRPPRYDGEFALARPETWPAPQHITSTSTARHGTARASGGDRLHSRLTHRSCWLDHHGEPRDRPKRRWQRVHCRRGDGALQDPLRRRDRKIVSARCESK
jgi:hypothetical protein